MRPLELAGAGAVLIGLAGPAAAQSDSRRFDIAPGPLGHVAAMIGAQAGVTIGVADPMLALRPSPGVRGTFGVETALARALHGTGARAAAIDGRTYRIVAVPPRQRASPSASPIVRRAPPLAEPSAEIIVTATKIPVPAGRYPGSLEIVDLDGAINGGTGALEGTLLRIPTISGTSLGPGRDKLFIRGIADSSFNGPTQETVGLYLDDVRLTYNAPDPDLNLYDMRRIEVLVGPQETLYGTGALGGIVRLSPNLPDASTTAGSAALGVSTTAHGGIGTDAAAMLNVPLGDRAALRVVGYRTLDAGYIDDSQRGLSNINRTVGRGGRIALRLDDRGGWTFDLGGVLQNIDSRDGQYTLRGDPPLTRSGSLAQPFDNDYRLAYVTARRRIGAAQIVSTTSIVDHNISSTFDATGFVGDGPAVLQEDTSITLISHETRLSASPSSSTPWIVGISLLDDISRVRRMLGSAAAPSAIASVRNDNFEGALFAHLSWSLLPRLVATVGGRATFSRSVGGLLGRDEDEVGEPRRTGFRATPSLSLSWQAVRRLQLYARYQRGARAGGLAVEAVNGRVSAQRFRPDGLTMVEFGLRRPEPVRGLWAHAAISYVGWNSIQADLIDDRGLPFTTNIGDGRIVTGEVSMGWRPVSGLTLEVSGFLADSALSSPTADLLPERDRDLPNVPSRGGRASAGWHGAVSPDLQLSLEGSVRYVGRSQLGIGPPLDVSQGEYVVAAARARLSHGRVGLSLDIDNIADARANRFAFGNPFGLELGNQETPLRPRTIRIGLDARF